MRHLPRFPALRAFEAAVRTGSLSAAARDLNVTPGAISRQINLLEEHVGTPLMRRHPQGAEATEIGLKLFRRLSLAFTDIEEALAEAAGDREKDVLTLSVYPTFAIQWLVPRLAHFHSREPKIDLQIRTCLTEPRFDREEIDLALMIGNGQWPGLTAQRLFSRRFTPVTSPELLRDLDRPAAEALRASRILYSDLHIRHWHLWLDRAELTGIRLDRGIRFDNSTLAYQAAREGGGFALGQTALLTDDLRSGRLVAPFDTVIDGDREYYIACRRRDAKRPAVQAFISWVQTELKASAAERPD